MLFTSSSSSLLLILVLHDAVFVVVVVVADTYFVTAYIHPPTHLLNSFILRHVRFMYLTQRSPKHTAQRSCSIAAVPPSGHPQFHIHTYSNPDTEGIQTTPGCNNLAAPDMSRSLWLLKDIYSPHSIRNLHDFGHALHKNIRKSPCQTTGKERWNLITLQIDMMQKTGESPPARQSNTECTTPLNMALYFAMTLLV